MPRWVPIASWLCLYQVVIQVIIGTEPGGHFEDPSRHKQVKGIERLLAREVVVQIAVGDGVDPDERNRTLDDARGVQDDTVIWERLNDLLIAFLFQYLI